MFGWIKCWMLYAIIKTVLNTDPTIKTASRICLNVLHFHLYVIFPMVHHVSRCLQQYENNVSWRIFSFSSQGGHQPHENPFDAFNPMNLILLTNQFELKLFNKTIGPNKTSGGWFSSANNFHGGKKKRNNFSNQSQIWNLPEVKELAMMETTQRLRPNVRIYSRTIKACDFSAKWKQAVCLLTIAESKEVQLDVIICTAAISFLVLRKWGELFWDVNGHLKHILCWCIGWGSKEQQSRGSCHEMFKKLAMTYGMISCHLLFLLFFSKVWDRKVLGRQWYDTDKPLWMIECAVPIEKVPCFVHKNVLQKYHPPKHPETNSSLTIPMVGRWISFRARPIFRGEFLVRGAWTKIDMILIQICVTYCRLSRSSFVQSNMVFICQLLCLSNHWQNGAGQDHFSISLERCFHDIVEASGMFFHFTIMLGLHHSKPKAFRLLWEGEWLASSLSTADILPRRALGGWDDLL